MLRKHKIVSASGIIVLSLAILNIIIIRAGFANNVNWYWALTVSLPLLLLAIFNIRQKKACALAQLSFNRICALFPRINTTRNKAVFF